MSGTRTRGPLMCPSLDAELTNCQSHYIENAKSPRNDGFVTQCATDGRYLPVQCRGDSNVTCSCVDQETGELRRGTDISITLGFPQCLSSDDSENMNLDYSKRTKASCLLPLRYGYCTQHDVRWYFDAATRTCQPFVYSGCGRNENNFKKEKQCKSACGHWGKN
ncbi:Kunitz-type protease inhibitor AFAPI-I [Exaiptasia diaphana]|nr:Kunitz-type protease inhibitor AFAPI-I [Exaiptasia diaphana]